MEPVIEFDGARVFHGDCVEVLKTFPENSVDAVVTDPPYGLEFMGKDWDAPWKKSEVVEVTDAKANGIFHSKGFDHGIRFNRGIREMRAFQDWATVWCVELLRVLKPGGHLLAFGGTRTWHRLAVAVEDAGFEVRDSIAWMYGSGFPKSLDVSKAIDKKAGAEREVIGVDRVRGNAPSMMGKTDPNNPDYDGTTVGVGTTYITAPSTPEAQKWQGWGTALKPAFEPIVVARKPLSGTVAETVLEWGTGGLNIDGSRIGTTDRFGGGSNGASGFAAGYESGDGWQPGSPNGRWPANVILDEVTAGLLDEQSGERKGMATQRSSAGMKVYGGNSLYESKTEFPAVREGYNDTGGASRFFYVAKASKRDRNEGLEELPLGEIFPQNNSLERKEMNATAESRVQNFHPTVKPTALMRYLVKLVTPPGGTVLDPFTGSGSTGKAAILEGFDFVGVELTDDYLPIIEGRLKWALENQDEGTLF